jgi:hypothetical protein
VGAFTPSTVKKRRAALVIQRVRVGGRERVKAVEGSEVDTVGFGEDYSRIKHSSEADEAVWA